MTIIATILATISGLIIVLPAHAGTTTLGDGTSGWGDSMNGNSYYHHETHSYGDNNNTEIEHWKSDYIGNDPAVREEHEQFKSKMIRCENEIHDRTQGDPLPFSCEGIYKP